MDRKKGRLLKWLSFAVAIVLIVYFGQRFLLRNMDYDQLRVEGFYMEEPDSLDVVFLGSSEVFRDYSAAQAYEEFGFTSYSYATNGNTVTLWKYALRDIIDRQHPKLIVVETNGALYDDDLLYKEVCLRRLVDNMPHSDVRNDMIRDLGGDELLSYYLPILKYHDNWEHPGKMYTGAENTLDLHMRGYSLFKGSSTNTSKMQPTAYLDVRGDRTVQPLGGKAEALLKDFLEYCRQEKLDNVVFVRFPHLVTQSEESYSRFARGNAAEQIIKEYGFDYINLDLYLDEMGVIPEDDFFNSEHMNVYGMKKMTSWYGRYLMDHYGITPKAQTDENVRRWQTCAAYTEAFYDYYDIVTKEDSKGGMEIGETKGIVLTLKSMLE